MLRNQIGQQTNASVIHGDKRLIQHPQRGVAQSQSRQGDAPFLSSGTWSLLGVKLAKPITSPDSCKANFTNEGGVGYIRYLKNIMGLWIIQCVQKQLGISFAEMVELAKTSTDRKSVV